MPTYETPKPIAVTADVLSGNVTVIASDRADTVVEVKPADPARKDDVRAASETRVGFTDGVLSVTTSKGWRTYSPFGGKASIEVRIEVPSGSRLKGAVALGRLLGAGDLGECDLEVAAGDILVESTSGSVTAKTAKGDIRIGEASHGVLRLETSMGELEVGIRPGSAVRVDSTTLHGHVQNLLQPVASTTDKDLVQVIAHNSYGNIIIHHATAA
ncbi:DUF4097 family beta strand repeat-containing protein [Nocardia crassostreae]|uniref:DUF4097 family beta strand repeat-containing protein n=1 Tax=Nocardia crassostreae TaxID=53428 RepID=UPI000835F35B|nr:DUF4097 family beta strand repeat-containing protein [Nocardia crassostreae]